MKTNLTRMSSKYRELIPAIQAGEIVLHLFRWNNKRCAHLTCSDSDKLYAFCERLNIPYKKWKQPQRYLMTADVHVWHVDLWGAPLQRAQREF